MSKSLNKDDLKKLFGGGLGFLKSSNENANPGDPALDKERDDYRKANQTLAIRNHQLKMELASSRRAMDELRGENEELRARLAALESTSLDERAEMIINQRIKKKLSQLTAISQRTMSYLGKATADFQSVLDDFGVDDVDENDLLAVCSTAEEGEEQRKEETNPRPGRANRPSTSHVPVLDKVEESPVRLRRATKPSSGRNKHGPIKVEAETPRVTADRRRSALISAPPLHMPDEDDVDATPRAAPQPPRRPQPAAALRTPAPPPAIDTAPNPFIETDDADENVNVNGDDTVRRKRNAAAKITSLAEPSLTTKMRRPGKHDAPCPYIS